MKINKPLPQASSCCGDSFTSFLPSVRDRFLPSTTTIVTKVFCGIQRGTNLYLRDANKTLSGSLPGKGVSKVRQINNNSKNPVKTAITEIKVVGTVNTLT
jgi:hypothetical protein